MEALDIDTLYGALAGADMMNVVGRDMYNFIVECAQNNEVTGPATIALNHPPCEGICGNAVGGGIVLGIVGLCESLQTRLSH